MIRAGIIGGAGYTAGELLRLLVNHPQVAVSFVHSVSAASRSVCEVHEGLAGDTDLVFTDEYDPAGVDVIFLCGAHGGSAAVLDERPVPASVKVIDLAQDFRDGGRGFVYGLPELNRKAIAGASRIANPGCFATAVELALLPLASAGLLVDEVQLTAITGSTGAGVRTSPTTHFSWRSGNVSTYKVFTHQHLAEIRRSLGAASPASDLPGINFVPVRGGFTRGIFAVMHTPCSLDTGALRSLYREFYADEPFTHVSESPVDLKQVVNTNKCLINVESIDGRAVVTSVIDNLLKGASGQAVQNMNIAFGLDERSALRLKASAF